MAFWSVSGPEPLRQYRWYLSFGSSLDDVSFALKKTDKPKAKVNSTQHKYMNHFFNYPGRLEWEDINVTFAAVTDPSASKIIWDVLTRAGYGVAGGNLPGTDMSSIGKQKFNGAIGDSISLYQVDAEGIAVEKWSIYRPFFTSVQFGSLDYGNEDIVEISCGIKYDWAKLEFGVASSSGNSGVNPGFPS